MNIIYKITYLPHVYNNTPPFYYIGSKYNYKNNYYGSPSSNQKDWYTEDLSIREWWKKEIKNNKDRFKFEIISVLSETITPEMLVEEEKKIQLEKNVRESVEYFNKSVATSGWVSVPRTDKTKKVVSEKTKKYWDSEEGQLKKQRLIERNKTEHSISMKEKWKNPTIEMLQNLEKWKNSKMTEQGKQKIKMALTKEIEYKEKIYFGWNDLLEKTGVTKHLYKKYYLNGYDPEVNIGNNINPQKIFLKK
jgi:hypothetical protein